MTLSALDLSSAAANQARVRAARQFERAGADARLATSAAIGLSVAAILMASTRGPEWYLVVVVIAAGLLAAAARSRMNRLERRLWWHQARAGLVEALEEQKAKKASSEETVIDLRDSADTKSQSSNN